MAEQEAAPKHLRWSERYMWDEPRPTQVEVRFLLGRLSRLREALAIAQAQKPADDLDDLIEFFEAAANEEEREK